jgi:hypothetical protein
MENENTKITFENFLMNDQPFVCPACGARTEQLTNFYHTNAKNLIEQCLNESCGLIYSVSDE